MPQHSRQSQAATESLPSSTSAAWRLRSFQSESQPFLDFRQTISQERHQTKPLFLHHILGVLRFTLEAGNVIPRALFYFVNKASNSWPNLSIFAESARLYAATFGHGLKSWITPDLFTLPSEISSWRTFFECLTPSWLKILGTLISTERCRTLS